MAAPILTTKLYILAPRPGIVLRPRLVERLNAGLEQHRLTLISASAGSGKTTLLSEWIAACGRKAAWVSLDEGDNVPALYLTYLIAAMTGLASDNPRRSEYRAQADRLIAENGFGGFARLIERYVD